MCIKHTQTPISLEYQISTLLQTSTEMKIDCLSFWDCVAWHCRTANKPLNICPFAFPFPIFKRQLRNWGISFVVLSSTLIYFSLNFISFIHAAGNMNLLLWILSNKTNVNRFSSRFVISGILVENIARIANAVQCHSLSLSICWSGLLSWSLWTDV